MVCLLHYDSKPFLKSSFPFSFPHDGFPKKIKRSPNHPCLAARVHTSARVLQTFLRVCIMLCVSVCILTFEPLIFMISVHAPPPHSGTSVILQYTCSLRESTSSSYDLSAFTLCGKNINNRKLLGLGSKTSNGVFFYGQEQTYVMICRPKFENCKKC